MQLSDMQVLHPQGVCLTREDILAVDVATRTLVLPVGPITFSGKDIALCFPDCPAVGLSFDDAGCLFKKEILKKELKLSKSDNRCMSHQHVKFRELASRRYELLKGEKLFGFMPWYIVSAVYAEYLGNDVNWADEVAGRMLEALLAFKHGNKKLKFEAEILKHIRLKMSELYGSKVILARQLVTQLVTPGEEQGSDVVQPVVEFSAPEGKREAELEPEPAEGKEEAGLEPEPAQQHMVLQEQEVVQECAVLSADKLQGFGEPEVLPQVSEVSEAAVVDKENEEILPCGGGGLEDGGFKAVEQGALEEQMDGCSPIVDDTGLEVMKNGPPEEIADSRRTEEEGLPKSLEGPMDTETVEVHLNFPVQPFPCEPASQEPVHVEVLECGAAEEQPEPGVRHDNCVPLDSSPAIVEDSMCLKEQDLRTAVVDSTCVKEQDLKTAGVDLQSSWHAVPSAHDVTIEDTVHVVKKRIQTRSTSSGTFISQTLQDQCRTKQEECKQLEAAIQEKERQRILSLKAKTKRTVTALHTAIRTNEESLSQARKQKSKLVQRHQKIDAKVREVEKEEKQLLKRFVEARERSSKHMAERDKALADGVKGMQALQAMKLVKVAEMHVKRRKMQEQNVPLEERDSVNSSQIWELEKALFDQGQSLDVLWEQWQTQHLKCEELMVQETTVHKCLLNSFQTSAQLQHEKAELMKESKQQDACIVELESKYAKLKESKKLAESGLQVENTFLDVCDMPVPMNLEPSTGCTKRKNLDIEREHKRRNQDTEREMANIWQRVKEQESVWSKRSVRGVKGVV